MLSKSLELSRTSWAFLLCEISCYFFFSIWWRQNVPVALGVSIGLFHLAGLIFILRLWESAAPHCKLVEAPYKTNRSLNSHWIWLVLLATGSAQIYFTGLPVLSGRDEPVLMMDHISQVASFRDFSSWQIMLFICCCVLLASTSGFLAKKVQFERYNLYAEVKQKFPWLLAFLLAGGLYGVMESNSHFNWGLAERWPPLGTVLSTPFQFLFSDKITAIRLVSVSFYLSTGYVTYKILQTEFNSRIALAGVIIVLTSPALFEYGHIAYREIGGTFFFVYSIYQFQRFLQEGDLDRYGLAIAMATFGYLQRRPAALTIAIFAISLLFLYRKELFYWKNMRALVLPVIALFWIAAPWLAISANIRSYSPEYSNLLELSHTSAYFLGLPGITGWLLVFLSIIGMIIGICQRKRLAWISIIWIFLLVLLYAMDITSPLVIDRFAIQFIPPLGILACYTLCKLSDVLPKFELLNFSIITLFACLTFFNWFLDHDRKFSLVPKNGLRFIDEDHYPFPQIADWLGQTNANAVLYLPVPWQSSLNTELHRREINGNKVIEASWNLKKGKVTITEALKSCRENNCDYLIVPANLQGEPIFHKGEDFESMKRNSEINQIHSFKNRHKVVFLVELSATE